MRTYIETMEERRILTERIATAKKQLEVDEARLVVLEAEIAQDEAEYQAKRKEHRRQILLRDE